VSAVASAARARPPPSWTNSKPTHLRFSVDIAFIGASGLTEDGITVVDVAEAQIKQPSSHAPDPSSSPWTAANSAPPTSAQSADSTRIDMITTERPNDEVIRWCNEHDVTLHVAE
jgi:DeoR/GlpR family transcriptional regulator of sugar metabolism